MIIADSSIWIDFQRDPDSEAGRELDQLLDADEVVMVGPVLTEVLQGARSGGELEFFSSHLTALLFLETSRGNLGQGRSVELPTEAERENVVRG